jgi:hypothetical protein
MQHATCTGLAMGICVLMLGAGCQDLWREAGGHWNEPPAADGGSPEPIGPRTPRAKHTCPPLTSEAGGFAVDCPHDAGHCGATPELKAAQWKFLQDHPFGADPEPYASGLPEGFPSACTIVEK